MKNGSFQFPLEFPNGSVRNRIVVKASFVPRSDRRHKLSKLFTRPKKRDFLSRMKFSPSSNHEAPIKTIARALILISTAGSDFSVNRLAVGLNEPQVLVRRPRDLREDIRRVGV